MNIFTPLDPASALPACVIETETVGLGTESFQQGRNYARRQEPQLLSPSIHEAPSSSPMSHLHHSKSPFVRPSSHPHYGLPYQDHNYGAPPPPTPPQSPPLLSTKPLANDDTTTHTKISSLATSEESVTRCICGFNHDDEYMICCDKCLVWQHVDCMGLDGAHIPETYLCEQCLPRSVDSSKARLLQARKKDVLITVVDTTSEESTTEDLVLHPSNLKRRPEMVLPHPIKSYSKEVEEVEEPWVHVVTAEEQQHYEDAMINQYSPEIQLRTFSCKPWRGPELLWEGRCKLADVGGSCTALVASQDLPSGLPLLEVRGRFLSISHFHPSQRCPPFVLFYHPEDVCVDATEYGNEARFVRRSHNPTAEVRPSLQNGLIHLYLISLGDIKMKQEVTVSYDYSSSKCLRNPSCNCNRDFASLALKKNGLRLRSRRRSRRSSSQEEESFPPSLPSSPVKNTKSSPIKISQPSPVSPPPSSDSNPSAPQEEDSEDHRRKMVSHPPSTPAGGCGLQKPVQTREERKLDAIVRAFERMEKTAKRRKQTLERLALKQQGPKPAAEEPPQEEEGVLSPAAPPSEEPKTLKKNSKRRRASGTPTKRCRTDSGGSDILSPDESVPPPSSPLPPLSPTVFSPPFPKTKKSLMQDWLQERTPSPTTCYVRWTHDTPSSISTAHLRRNSLSGTNNIKQQATGSAKKRWLRQAMFEDPEELDLLEISGDGFEMSSPTEELATTPLKKRRLLRESLESDPSTPPSSEEQEASLPPHCVPQSPDYPPTPFPETRPKVDEGGEKAP